MEGPETYDPKKRFAEYLKEKEGKPVDSRAVEAGKKELEQGRKGGFAVYGDELDKETKMKGYPKGRLSEESEEEEEEKEKKEETTEPESALTPEEAATQLFGMTGIAEEARKYYREGNLKPMELKSLISELKVAKKMIDRFLKEREEGQIGIPNEIGLVIKKMINKYNIRATLNSLPREIEKLIEKYTAALGSTEDKQNE